MNQIINIFNKLNLTKTEKVIIQKFKENNRSRSFLPASDILRNHGFKDEAIELLIFGVQNHPDFTSARVLLARELYEQGIYQEALSYLNNSPDCLGSNGLAQRLHFKIYLILNNETLFRNLNQTLTRRNFHDSETNEISTLFENTTFSELREIFVKRLQSQGITSSHFHQDSPANEKKASTKDSFEDQKLNEAIKGFHVVPIREIFFTDLSMEDKKSSKEKLELDSLTLGEIYERQGLLSQAVKVYERLLQLSPRSELLRKKFYGTSQAWEKQKLVDGHIDPEAVSRMEQAAIVDTQIHYLEELLGNLERYD